MQTIATLHPRARTVDGPALDAMTVLAHHGGYDLSVSTGIAALCGFALESSYLGSDEAGYRGAHLVLARAGHRFLASSRLEPCGGPSWWRRAILDHYAVLHEELVHLAGEAVMLEIPDPGSCGPRA